MQIKNVMSPHVEMIDSSASVKAAAEKMKQLGSGVLPVSSNNAIKGIITDRDITIRAVAEGLDPDSTTVGQVMTSQVFFCYEDQPVEDVAKLMEEKNIRRILVYSRDNRVTGIVSIGDIATHGAGAVAEEVLEKVSEAPANA
jgi:CBS domain-containing protein